MLARTDANEARRAGSPDPAHLAHPRTNQFRKARLHSRDVRWMRVVMPILAVVLTVVFSGYTYLVSSSTLNVDVGAAAFAEGKLVMANPKLDGFTKDSRPYSMTATRALQDLDKEGVVELEQIVANLPVDAENWASIDALHGVYDNGTNTLDVNSAMTVRTTNGLLAKLQSAFLNINDGALKTTDPVDITLDGTNITADTMTILENGKVLIFDKRVRMNIQPGKMTAGNETGGGKNAAN